MMVYLALFSLLLLGTCNSWNVKPEKKSGITKVSILFFCTINSISSGCSKKIDMLLQASEKKDLFCLLQLNVKN